MAIFEAPDGASQGSLPGFGPPENLGEDGKGKGWKNKKTEKAERPKHKPIVKIPESLWQRPRAERKDID